MWVEYQEGRVPQPDLTNLDVYLEVGTEQNYDEIEVQAMDDYRTSWLENLVRRDTFRPIGPDRRLWTRLGRRH
jgi:hypothetical protein